MHAAKSALPSSRERRANFRRVMPVIVDHSDARSVTFKLEPPIHAAKTVKAETNLVWRNVERGANRNRRRGVQHVVRAGNMQRKLAEILLLICHLKADQRRVLSTAVQRPAANQEIRSR